MPVMLSVTSVVDPGMTRVTIEVLGDNAGGDAQLLRRLRVLLTLAREQKHQQSMRVPGVTAGAEILLFLLCFFTLAVVVRVFLHLMSVSPAVVVNLCCFSVYVFYVHCCKFLEALLLCYDNFSKLGCFPLLHFMKTRDF